MFIVNSQSLCVQSSIRATKEINRNLCFPGQNGIT